MGLSTRTYAIVAVAVMLFGLLGYGVGRYQGAQQTDAAQQALDAAQIQHAQSIGEFESKLRIQSNRVALLEARRQLDLASSALQERNFGISQGHLRSAGSLLDENPTPGMDNLKVLAQQVNSTNVTTADDLMMQHLTLRSFVSYFDQAVPPPPSKLVSRPLAAPLPGMAAEAAPTQGDSAPQAAPTAPVADPADR